MHTPWQIAVSQLQRQAIASDPLWLGGDYEPHTPPHTGLALARQIAMVSYRTQPAFVRKFGREVTEEGDFQVNSYLTYQGLKFLSRFDPLSYVRMTHIMDTHDAGRHRGGVEAALGRVRIPVQVLAVDSDVLYPPHEQEQLYEALPPPLSTYTLVRSSEGHDGFLLEQDQVGGAIFNHLEEQTGRQFF